MTAQRLPAQQRRAAELLALGGDPATVAAECGVTARTLRRWRRDPAFIAALTTATAGTFAQARQRVAAISTTAAETLATVLTDPATPAAVRVRAALGVLDLAAKLDHDDLADRLTTLEQSWNLRAVV